MKKAILIEKLNDIRDKVDVVRHATLIMDLNHIYEDLTEILEDFE